VRRTQQPGSRLLAQEGVDRWPGQVRDASDLGDRHTARCGRLDERGELGRCSVAGRDRLRAAFPYFGEPPTELILVHGRKVLDTRVVCQVLYRCRYSRNRPGANQLSGDSAATRARPTEVYLHEQHGR
jgi:hypothetical protein